MYVDQYYEMNPETEIQISAADLRGDMVVLCANPADRCDTEDKANFETAQVSNRWAKIFDVYVHNNKYQLTYVTFVAEYEDGTKHRRTVGLDSAWLVKIDSTPEYKKQRGVLEIVRAAVAVQFDDPIKANEYAITLAEQIFEILDR